ncbi:hypothetical protein RCL1_001728 [Eukaryota sp. TZLM3-RCL]
MAENNPQLDSVLIDIQSFLDDLLRSLETTVNTIKPGTVQNCFNRLFSIMNTRLNQDEKAVCERLKQFITESLHIYLPTVSHELNQYQGKTKLEVFAKKWKTFQYVQAGYAAVFAPVDYTIITFDPKGGAVVDIVRECFYTCVFEPLTSDLLRLLMQHIDQQRHSLTPDQSIIRSVCQLLAEMETVKETFKTMIFQHLKSELNTVYSKHRDSLLGSSMLEYYTGIRPFINREREILTAFVKCYVDHFNTVSVKKQAKPSTHQLQASSSSTTFQNQTPTHTPTDPVVFTKPLFDVLYRELINQTRAVLFEPNVTAFHSLLRENRNDELNLIYELFRDGDLNTDSSRANVKFLADQYALFIRNSYASLGSQRDSPHQLVVDISNILHHTRNLLTGPFALDPVFQKVFNDVHKECCRAISDLSVHLSSYLNQQLVSGFSSLSEAEITEILHKSLDVFVFSSDKVAFEQSYKAFLADRLLFRQSNIDNEQEIISLFKNEIGSQVAQTFNSMINDIQTSQEVLLDFQLRTTRNLEFNFAPTIVATGRWPYPSFSTVFFLPDQLKTAVDAYKEFYLSKFGSRKLNFQPNLGTVDLEFRPRAATDGHGVYIFNVTTSMALILLLFNNANTKTFKSILEETGLPQDEARVCLQPLLASSILLKKKDAIVDPRNPVFGDNFVFALNIKFKNERVRLTLHRFRLPESTKTLQERELSESRNQEVDAAIVRILKGAQSISHRELQQSVIQALLLRFEPTVELIKRRIEHLMETGYMERSPDDRNTYLYIA